MTKKSKIGSRAVIVAAIIIILCFGLWWLMRPQTTNTSKANDNAVVTSMTCTAGDVENTVFATSGASDITYTVNALFRDDELSNLTFSYLGTYTDHDAAVAAETRAHADYNIKLQNMGYTEGYFSGTNWSVLDNKLQLTFTADADILIPAVAEFVMMDGEGEIALDYDSVRANYVAHSFVCEDVVTAN